MTEKPTLAIATCSDFPELTPDDRLLLPHLRALGIEAEPLIWNGKNPASTAGTILLRSTWDYYLKPGAFLKWLDEIEDSGRELLNPVETVRWNIDKTYLLELEWAGVPCFPSLVLKRGEKPDAVLNEIRTRGWRELVIKPTISAGSYLTYRIDAAATELTQRLIEIQRHSDVLIQPFAGNIASEGEASLVYFRSADDEISLSHSVAKRPKSGDFRVQMDFGGSTVACEAPAPALAAAEATLSAIPGEWIYARVDLLDWKREPLLSEIELIEPCLFLGYHPESAKNFAETLAGYI